jgi:hypothetical protein
VTSPEAQHVAVGAGDTEPTCEYTITMRVTPSCLRLEMTKPYKEQVGWAAILDAVADRWGHYGTAGGQQTLWAELTWPRDPPGHSVDGPMHSLAVQ